MISEIQITSLLKFHKDNLFNDLEKFIDDWKNSIKKCSCENIECKHYQKEKWDRFGERLSKGFKRSVMLNTITFSSGFKQVR